MIFGRGCPSARGRRQPSPVRNRAIRSLRAEPLSRRARPALLALPLPLPGALAGGLLGLLARAQVVIGVRGVTVAVAVGGGRIGRLRGGLGVNADRVGVVAEPFGGAPLPAVVT